MSTQLYCLTCKTKTDTENITRELSKNDRKIIKGNCKVCERKKSQFIKMDNKTDKKVKDTKTNTNKVKDSEKSILDLIDLIKQLSEDIKKLIPIEDELKKYGKGLYLGRQSYEGGFLPLAALIPLLGGILGGVGGLAGGIGSAVNGAKANREQERHNRDLEELVKKSGSGLISNVLDYIPVIGKYMKPLAEKLGLGKECCGTLKKCECNLSKHGMGIFLGKQA
jgi:hypothetical protein